MNLRTVLGILVLAGALATSGCSGDDPKVDPGATGSATASESDTGSTSASDTGSEPTADPATGTVLQTDNASINAPKGWTDPGESTPRFKALFSKDGLNSVTLSDYGFVNAENDPEAKLRSVLAKDERAKATFNNATLGGAPAAHASYEDGTFTNDFYGGFSEGNFVYVLVQQYADVPATERQAIIDSVLASFTWK